MATTTIQVNKKVRERLNGLKLHPRETLNDIIERLLEDFEELNEETKKEIKEAIAAIAGAVAGAIHGEEAISPEWIQRVSVSSGVCLKVVKGMDLISTADRLAGLSRTWESRS
jgi:sugar-specific transcriptional regulator TrmB